MKKMVYSIILLYILSGFSNKIVAQEHLNALVKKCETEKMDGNVWTEVIYSKNDRTKKFEPTISTLSIESNPILINEFLTALKKDEETALEKSETRVAGKIYKLSYSFENTDYTFYYEGEKGEKGECTGIKVHRIISEEKNASK